MRNSWNYQTRNRENCTKTKLNIQKSIIMDRK